MFFTNPFSAITKSKIQKHNDLIEMCKDESISTKQINCFIEKNDFSIFEIQSAICIMMKKRKTSQRTYDCCELFFIFLDIMTNSKLNLGILREACVLDHIQMVRMIFEHSNVDIEEFKKHVIPYILKHDRINLLRYVFGSEFYFSESVIEENASSIVHFCIDYDSRMCLFELLEDGRFVRNEEDWILCREWADHYNIKINHFYKKQTYLNNEHDDLNENFNYLFKCAKKSRETCSFKKSPPICIPVRKKIK